MGKGPGRPATERAAQDGMVDVSASPVHIRCRGKVYVLSCDEAGNLTIFAHTHEGLRKSLMLEVREPHFIKLH